MSASIREKIVIGVLILLAGLVCLKGVSYFTVSPSLDGRPHTYPRREPANGFTETEALQIAKQTLIDEGYDLAEWEPDGGSPTSDSIGRKDQFFYRNGLDPNIGLFQFIKRENDGIRTRLVEIIEVSDKEVVTLVRIPK